MNADGGLDPDTIDALIEEDSQALFSPSRDARTADEPNTGFSTVALTMSLPPSPPIGHLINQEAVENAPPPTFLPFGSNSNAILTLLLLIVVRCAWLKNKAMFLNIMMCALQLVAVGPLRSPAEGVIEKMHHALHPVDDPMQDDLMETGRVDGSSEVDEVGVHNRAHNPRPPQGREPIPRPRGRDRRDPNRRRACRLNGTTTGRGGGGAGTYVDLVDTADATNLMQGMYEVNINDEEELLQAKEAGVEQFEEEVEEVEEVEEIDEKFDADALQTAAEIQSRLDALEKKIAKGGTVTLTDLAGTRARVSETGEFMTADQPLNARRGTDDDSFTMVGLPTQTQQTLLPTQRDSDKRQAKLEEALRIQKERKSRETNAEHHAQMHVARRKLRSELLVIDREIDGLLAGSAATRGGPPSQLLAAQWLVMHAYEHHPPPSLTAHRAQGEVRAARELRFRDATMTALKVLQARYAPAKNSIQDHGADWAVIAEEICKHAFSLQQGLSRSQRQEQLAPASHLFSRDDEQDDGISYSLTHGHEEVEDAD